MDAYQIIDNAEYAMLVAFDYEIYAVALSAARIENKIYFKSVNQGKKVDIFEQEHYVKMIFVTDVNVPDVMSDEEIEAALKDGNKFLHDKVYTTDFRSVIVDGFIDKVESEEEKFAALEALCKKYTPGKEKYLNEALLALEGNYHIYRIDITNTSVKEKITK